MSHATQTDAGILAIPVQLQKLPEPAAVADTGMELSDDELEAVVGGLARTVEPQTLLRAAA